MIPKEKITDLSLMVIYHQLMFRGGRPRSRRQKLIIKAYSRAFKRFTKGVAQELVERLENALLYGA